MVSKKIRASLLVVVATVTTVATGIRPGAAESDSEKLIGSWIATARVEVPPGLPPLTSLITFSPGGGVVESRRLLTESPFGTLLETAGHGEWVEDEDDRYRVKFLFLLQSFDTGELLGTDTVQLDLRLEKTDDGGCELNGRFESVVRDVDEVELFRASGTYAGNPISVRNKCGDHDHDDDD